jgi:hypothetical protein
VLTLALWGDHQDERQTFIVHSPWNNGLNIDAHSIAKSSYVWTPQASVGATTQDGGAGWAVNPVSNFTLNLTFTAGGAAATWKYTARLLMGQDLSSDFANTITASGTVGAQATLAAPVALTGSQSFLVAARLVGNLQDERKTYIVNVPLNGNLNVDAFNLASSSYASSPQASIGARTQDSGGGWQANASANYILNLLFTGGGSPPPWAYVAVPLARTPTTGTIAAQTSTTQNIVLQGPGSYLVTASLYGDHQDERQVYVVHAPVNGNLNVDFKQLSKDSYVWAPQASIVFSTQNSGGGWQANNASNFTLRIGYTAGGSQATWGYSVVPLL